MGWAAAVSIVMFLVVLSISVVQTRLLRAEWEGEEGSRRRKFYAITDAGRRRLEKERQGWEAFTRHVDRLLGVETQP